MKNYLNTLNEREKWMVIAAVFCVFIYGYYMLLYAPLSTRVAQKSTQLIEKKETLAWMKKVKTQNHSSKKKESIGNTQLLTVLANQLKDNQTLRAPYQLQQTSSGEIELTFDAVPFKLFLTWLATINKQYVITIKQFDATRTETPGVTKLTIIISAG